MSRTAALIALILAGAAACGPTSVVGYAAYSRYSACHAFTRLESLGTTYIYAAAYHPLSGTCTVYPTSGRPVVMTWDGDTWVEPVEP